MIISDLGPARNSLEICTETYGMFTYMEWVLELLPILDLTEFTKTWALESLKFLISPRVTNTHGIKRWFPY